MTHVFFVPGPISEPVQGIQGMLVFLGLVEGTPVFLGSSPILGPVETDLPWRTAEKVVRVDLIRSSCYSLTVKCRDVGLISVWKWQ